MARRIIDEEMRFSIIINGDPAQKELHEVERATEDLVKANNKLRTQQARLERQGKQNTEQYKKNSAELKKNTAEIKANHARMKVLESQIGVTGLTMAQLQKRAAQLRLALRHSIPDSAQAKAYVAQLKQVNLQLQKLRNNGRAAQGAMSRLADRFTKYAALGASVIVTTTGIVLSAQKMIDFNGKLADSQANVMKTTQLTKEEVDDLTKSFGLFKTRTTRIELLKLAEEAGRLGTRGVDNIQKFVETANEIKVALGDDLSDDQIREVGKIANIYEVGAKNNMEFAESFQAVGSAINDVAATGTAQAGFLVDYLKRTSGAAKTANITAEANIGLAATFDEIGQSVEISATAINKVMFDMFDNTKTYAKIAGMTEQAFGDLLNTNANEALLRFFEGLRGNEEGLSVMVEKLNELGVDGARSVQALSAVSNATDLVRQRQEQAGKALRENTSLTEEYTIKNNNLAATLEKIQRRVRGVFLSENVAKGLENLVNWFAKFIGASDDVDGSVTRTRNTLIAILKTIIILTAAIISYNTAVKLTELWTNRAYKATKLYQLIQKASIITTNTLKSATLLLKAGYFLLTGQVTRARAAMVLFNRTMLLSPLGLFVAALTAAVVAYKLFSDSQKNAVTSQSLFNSAQKEAIANTAEDVAQKNLWLKVAQSENTSRAQKQKAIDELNRTVPEYNNQLTIETANTDAATKALDKHIEALKNNAIALALQERIKKKAVELADLENSTLEANIEWYEKLWNGFLSGGNNVAYYSKNQKDALENKYETIEATKEEIAILEKLYETQLKNNADSGADPAGPKEGDIKFIGDQKFIYRSGKWVRVPTYKPKGDSGNDTKLKDQREKEAAELLKLQRETEDNRIKLIQDSFEREMVQADANHQRKIQDLQAKLIDQNTIDNTRNGGNEQLAQLYEQQNAQIIEQIEQQEFLHQQSLNEILEKGIKQRIDAKIEEFNREEQERLIAHNNELAALGNNKLAKQQLQDRFNKEKLERQKAHEKLLVAELQKILDTATFEDFSLELLTDEQLQVIKDRLSSLGLSISEINALLAKMRGEEVDLGFVAGGDVDVLGFTQEQWETIFSNSETLASTIGKVGNVLQAASQAYAIYDGFVRASEEKRLQKLEKETELGIKKQKHLLESGMINQRQHDDAVEAMEAKLQKKRLEMEYKQAKRQKAMNIAAILGNQAVAVSKALAQGGFVLGIPWAGIVAGLAGLQLALAVAQPLPAKGYEKGFGMDNFLVKRDQDGKVFNAGFGGNSRSGVVDKPTVFLAGEGGKNFPEMIIDGKTLKQFDPDLKSRLYRELSRVRGFENGFVQPPKEDTNQSSIDVEALNLTLVRVADVLADIQKKGIPAYMSKRSRDIEELRDELNKYEKRVTKNQR